MGFEGMLEARAQKRRDEMNNIQRQSSSDDDEPAHYYEWGKKVYYNNDENIKQSMKEAKEEKARATKEREEWLNSGGW